MRYFNVSTLQIICASFLIAIITSALVTINILVKDYFLRPAVHTDAAGVCVKVVNYENGQAFNCNDVDVVLRIYRKVTNK